MQCSVWQWSVWCSSATVMVDEELEAAVVDDEGIGAWATDALRQIYRGDSPNCVQSNIRSAPLHPRIDSVKHRRQRR